MKNTSLIISSALSESDRDDEAEAGSHVEWREVVVTPAQHGSRLDKVLVDAIPEFSRSYLQQLIADGAVEVNGLVAAKTSARLKAGDRGRVVLQPTPQSQSFTPQAMVLQIVFEDEHLLIVDKPAGLVVHPAPGNWSGTLLNGLLARDTCFAHLPRAGIVHRLDKDTSGLMLVARSRPAMDALVRMIAARAVQRQYLALAHKPWSGPAVRGIREPVGRDPRNRLRMSVVDLARHAGKAAATTVELLANCEKGCLVRCTLHTGRTHQIRVHMAFIDHPLVADGVYGGTPAAGLHRQALHAFHLALAHPVTGQAMDFRSPLPADLEAALSQWGLRYNPPR